MAKIRIDLGGGDEKLRAEMLDRAVNGEVLVALPAEREWFKRMVSNIAFAPSVAYVAPGEERKGEIGRLYGVTVFVSMPKKEVIELVKEFKREILKGTENEG